MKVIKNQLIYQQFEYLAEMLLDDYSDWMHEKGYIDADYYTEEPKAVKAYLKEKFNQQNK